MPRPQKASIHYPTLPWTAQSATEGEILQFRRMNPENCDPTQPIAKNGENTATYTDHAGE